jgi:predicted site-specific integrase-resolvase
VARSEWWTKKQACEHLQIDPKTFERYVTAGMNITKLRGRVYVRREVIQAEYRRRKLNEKATRTTR